MSEETSVEGLVEKIVPWESGKGYFLNIEFDENDYFGYGSSKAKIDSVVAIEFKKGSGSFGGKRQITKLVLVDKSEKDSQGDSIKSVGANPAPHINGVSANEKRQELIMRQSCMKAASAFVSNSLTPEKNPDWSERVKLVTDISDDFYKKAVLRN